MTKEEFRKLTENILILDGATGSNLMASGMPRGICTETWVIDHKDIIQDLQRAYIQAGSQVIYAPTFGGNSINLEKHGLRDKIEEINRTLVGYSKELAGSGMPFKHVVREVEQFIYQMQTLFVLESLENLRKNGRLTKLQAVVTGALRIKLLMGATPQGEICKLGQALTMKQALGKLVDRMAADPDHQGRVAAVCHCNCLERAFALKEQIEAKCQFQQVLILEAGGITTVYANDGGVVVAY